MARKLEAGEDRRGMQSIRSDFPEGSAYRLKRRSFLSLAGVSIPGMAVPRVQATDSGPEIAFGYGGRPMIVEASCEIDPQGFGQHGYGGLAITEAA